MPNRPYLCVFCGSSKGLRPSYAESARRVGRALAEDGIGLVYGGGRVGLMGILADAALAAGGRVVGVIPEALASKEIAHPGLTELIIVATMHERKAIMADRACGFLMLPGGVGTFEEFFEILTWAALGLHNKPIGILDVDGYFEPIQALLNHAVVEEFVRPRHLELVFVSNDPETVARDLLNRVPPPPGPKWIDIDET